jgi:hypothetical protein
MRSASSLGGGRTLDGEGGAPQGIASSSSSSLLQIGDVSMQLTAGSEAEREGGLLVGEGVGAGELGGEHQWEAAGLRSKASKRRRRLSSELPSPTAGAAVNSTLLVRSTAPLGPVRLPEPDPEKGKRLEIC